MKRMDMQTQHGECFLDLRKPCRHCREVEKRERKRLLEELEKEKPNCIVIGLGKHEYNNNLVCSKCGHKKKFSYRFGHASV